MAAEIKGIIKDKFPKDKKPFVVEIGSNDGVMLEHLVNSGIDCLGVEPSTNVAEISHQYGVETINEFISVNTAEKISLKYGKANFIYAANVFCHIPDINDLAKATRDALERKVQTIHICENPTLESYSKKLWKFIKVQKINSYVYKYNIFKRNKLIKFGNNVNLYKKYL